MEQVTSKPAGPTVTVAYTHSVDHELRALRLHWRAVLRPSVRWLARVIGALILALLAYSIVVAGPTSTSVGLAVACVCGFSAPWEARWRRRRRYPATPGANAPVTITLSDDLIEMRAGELVHSKVAWPVIAKAVCAPDGVLLYTTPVTFVWAPYAGLSRQEDRRTLDDLVARRTTGRIQRVS